MKDGLENWLGRESWGFFKICCVYADTSPVAKVEAEEGVNGWKESIEGK